MTKSQTAERKGIDNVPNADHIFNLTALCENILQPIRNEFGSFIVSSGYRSPELCEAIGSKATSQHAKGEAADFEVAGISGWIHCSYVPDGRKETLTYNRSEGYRKGLLHGG